LYLVLLGLFGNLLNLKRFKMLELLGQYLCNASCALEVQTSIPVM